MKPRSGLRIQTMLFTLVLSVLIAVPGTGLAVTPPPTATLHVIKHVINDNGEIAVASSFNLHVKDTFGNEVAGSPAPGAESPGTTYILAPGTYVVTEDGYDQLAYGVTYSGDFDFAGGNTVTLNPGDIKTVTLINDDMINEGIQQATLHVIKQVINDNGGTAVAADFILHVTNLAGTDVVGSPAAGVEAPGKTYKLNPGIYKVKEEAAPGYTVSYSGDLDANGNISLNPGDVKTVTVTNDDDPVELPEAEEPSDPEEPSDTENPSDTEEPQTPTLDFTYGYINGYTDGNVGYNDSLTREQVSGSLYRIFKQAGITQGYVKPVVSDFSDLPTTRWSYASIEYMVSIGAIPKGDTVEPLEPVTRGEMAKIIAISNKLTDKTNNRTFPDLPASHEYYDYMNMIVNAGLLVGYPNGEIKPDGFITRAEYITMINRFIGRDKRYNVEGLPSLYTDLLPTHWAFADIQRASFGFTTTVDEQGYFQVDPSIGISKADLDN